MVCFHPDTQLVRVLRGTHFQKVTWQLISKALNDITFDPAIMLLRSLYHLSSV